VARGRPVPRRDCFAPRFVPIARPLSPAFGSRMVNPFQFMQEVRSETGKISWPTRRETLITSGLVILMVLFASLFFVVVDWALRFGVGLLLHIGQ
jgi:preprotein translocase subunit SecE